MVGDLNYHKMHGKTWVNSTDENSEVFSFLEALRETYLYQHVTIQARLGQNPNTLELILTNEEIMISDLEY